MRKWLLLAFVLSPLSAFADVTFYGQCDYKGNSVSLAPGDYTAAELARFGIPEDVIASIEVPRGYVVTVHEHDNFNGRYGTLRRSDSCLDNDRFSKIISSVSIRESLGTSSSTLGSTAKPETANSVTVYSECNYRGRSASLAVGDYNLAQLEKSGINNNAISSIKVPKGYSIKLFENDFLRGRAGVLTVDDDCLADDNFDNIVTSVSVRADASVKAAQQVEPVVERSPVAIYTACNYRSAVVNLKEGEYTSTALAKLGLQNNTISSIQVAPGYQIELFENDFYRGRSGTLRQDDPCLIDDRFNDTISSVIISKDPRAKAVASAKASANPPAVTVFAHCNYKGGSVQLPVGRYTTKALLDNKVRDNVISSLKLNEGFKVTLYDADGFAGKGVVITANDDCLDDNNINESVSSLIIEPVVQQTSTSLRELLPQKPTSSLDIVAVDKALACVKQYVDRDLCDSHRWKDMEKNCSLRQVPQLNDGFFRGHVDAGNCKTQYWSELSRLAANPQLR